MKSPALVNRLGSFLLLTLLLTVSAFTQSSSSLTGEVQDAQGNLLPNAKVTLTEPTNNRQFDTTTGNEGTFSFPTLQPGTYTLTVEAQGFKQFIKNGIVVNPADRQSAGTLTLEVGEVSQSVTVTADAAQLAIKTESGEQGDTITGQQVRDLALNGRNYLDLMKLVPGLVSTVSGQVAGPGGLGSFNINGTRGNQHNLTIDGSTNVDTGSNGTQHVALNVDTIAEFKVLTSNYQAEYGRSAGGDIKIVTRGGGNEFHGTGYLFHRHEGLNANSFFNNANGVNGIGVQNNERPLYRYNYFGYNVSGPVVLPRFGEGGKPFYNGKDKLFFFFGQEFQRQLVPTTARQVRVPTAAEVSGNFNQTFDGNNVKVTIIDPLTKQQFPDNIIPANRINPSGQAILRRFNQAENSPQTLALNHYNSNTQLSSSYPRREETIRIDYNLSNSTRLFARYTQDHDQQILPYGVGWTSGQNFPLTPTIFNQGPARNAALNITTTLSPTMTNEFIFGPSQNNLTLNPIDPNAATFSGLGLGFTPPFPYAPDQFINVNFTGTPNINFADIFGYSQFPYKNSNTTFDFIDNVSKVFGSHTTKAGIYIQRSRKDQAAGDSMTINFNNNPTNPFNAGHPYANALLGNFDTLSEPNRPVYQGKYRSTNVEFFIQDNWKFNQRLTLDYGMRFAYIGPQYDQRNQASFFNPSLYDFSKAVRLYRQDISGQAYDPASPTTLLPSYLIGQVVPNSGNPYNGLGLTSQGYERGGIQSRGLQLGPAVGFAYDVFGDQKTVVRGGYRIGYDRVSGNTLIFPAVGNPPANINPVFTFGNLNTVGASAGQVTLPPFNVIGADTAGFLPNVQSFSLQVQREIGFSTVLSVAYVGSLSHHLAQQRNLNYIPYGTTFTKAAQDPSQYAGGVVPDIEPGLPDVYRQAGFNFSGRYALPVNFLRRYPGYGDIAYQESVGSSNYHSLQVTVQRRFTSGFTYGLAYTYSKALGTANGDNDYSNPVDTRGYDYRRLDFDRTHVLAINYIYDLPKVSRRLGDNIIAKGLLDNWELSGITQFSTGQPADVGFGISDVNLNPRITGSYTEGPGIRLVGDPKGPRTREQWFDYTAISLPNIGDFGPYSRAYLTRPGINVTDLSLFKNFPFGGEGSRYLQLRFEAFNVFNHPNFDNFNNGLTFNISPDFSNYRQNQRASATTIQNVRGSGGTGSFGSTVGEFNGQPGYVSNSRVIQLAVKLYF